jgi:hypothetical protein
MCHSLKWEEWELLADEELRKEEKPLVVEVAHEREAEEPELERERDPERELVRA